MPENAWIRQNKQDSEYASSPMDEYVWIGCEYTWICLNLR